MSRTGECRTFGGNRQTHTSCVGSREGQTKDNMFSLSVDLNIACTQNYTHTHTHTHTYGKTHLVTNTHTHTHTGKLQIDAHLSGKKIYSLVLFRSLSIHVHACESVCSCTDEHVLLNAGIVSAFICTSECMHTQGKVCICSLPVSGHACRNKCVCVFLCLRSWTSSSVRSNV